MTTSNANENYFNIENFNQLLQRLEASKGRQVRQKAVEGRRDIFAQGLAGMMGNFWFSCILEQCLPPFLKANVILTIGLI